MHPIFPKILQKEKSSFFGFYNIQREVITHPTLLKAVRNLSIYIMNSGSELYNVGRARLSKLGATPKLDVVEWPILIKMLQARTRLEQEAPPGEYTRLITEVWNILLRELPSSSKETRRRLKKHAGNPSFVVRDDGKF